MIPSVDSSGYTPLLELQALNDPASEAAASPLSSTNTQSSVTSQLAEGLRETSASYVQPRPGFSLQKIQKLLETMTKMLEALTKLIYPEPTLELLPFQPETVVHVPEVPGLTLIDDEPTLVIPSPDAPPTAEPPTTTDPVAGNPVNDTTTPPGEPTLPIDSQEEIPDLPPINPTNGMKQYEIGSKLRGSGQFLWKPVSDKDGNLAILTPPKLTGKIKSVVILSPDKTKILGKGSFSGVGNGDREHFRFSKSGGEYPDKSIALITLKDGSKLYVPIRESSARYTV